MTKAHKKALATARKRVREAETDLGIAEFDYHRAKEDLGIAKRSLRLLQLQMIRIGRRMKA